MKSLDDGVLEPLDMTVPVREPMYGSWEAPICTKCAGVMAWDKTDDATVVCTGVTRGGCERELKCTECGAYAMTAVFYNNTESDHE